MTMTMTMTMKISLFDINHLNTMIRKNKAKKIMWLMNRDHTKQYRMSISQANRDDDNNNILGS